MSGVLTNDVYKRLLKPDASDKHYVLVARINMVMVGLIVLVGAMFVGALGGAFEANKLLTSLFAIPVAIPLIFGLIMKRPRPLGAIITVIVGIITGLVLNAYPEVPWEYATLTSILVCFFTFVISGLFESKKPEYRERVAEFFKKINTPLSDDEKPKIDPAFQRSLAKLFAIALSLSGFLFMGMSIPSLGVFSGNVGLLGGFLCLLIAGIIYFLVIKPLNKRSNK
jgi:Na+/proline symporter